MSSRIALVLVAIALAGCGSVVPAPTAVGAVSIAVVRADNLFLGSHHEARLVADDGTVVAGSEVPADAPATISVPAGAWTLEAFTVFVSDAGVCGPDPADPAKDRCVFPTTGPKFFCRLPVTVQADQITAVRLTVEEADCRLEAVPAADGSGASPT